MTTSLAIVFIVLLALIVWEGVTLRKSRKLLAELKAHTSEAEHVLRMFTYEEIQKMQEDKERIGWFESRWLNGGFSLDMSKGFRHAIDADMDKVNEERKSAEDWAEQEHASRTGGPA